ncbi:CDK2-associated and cullin domain-containing protein 1-like [Tubulanus polymorphus]|uniref:CDK2-associated and cullin domain-containing protein 1-like n=1 Tax=Tubulanus polymorphus TaxID=672921 RepID=UPI003DA337BF
MMDEPMDDAMCDSTTGEIESFIDGAAANSEIELEEDAASSSLVVSSPPQHDDELTPKFSVLKPGSGSMMLMKISDEDYEKKYWPRLDSAINQLLTMKPGEYIPISYEQMYSCVYKCVCKQFSERLYNDLCQKITTHLQQISIQLQTSSHDSKLYIKEFHNALNQYLKALGGIVPIFNYMNRFYVENKLRTDLKVELLKLFADYVADKHVPVILPLVVEASSEPFTFPPAMMSTLVRNLYSLKPEFSQMRPHLFAKYIPNVMPATAESDLTQLIEETKRMQRDLRTHPLFMSGDQSKKRGIEDDAQMCTGIPMS